MLKQTRHLKLMRILILFLLIQFASVDLISDQEVSVPVNIQIQLIQKIFSFDRNFRSRIKGEIVFLVIYQRNYRASLNIKNEINELVQTQEYQSYQEFNIKYKYLNIETTSDLERYLSNNYVSVIYICPLKIIDISGISEITQSKKIISIASVPDYIEDGISVGFEIKEDRPQIYINLKQAKSEGIDFSSQLLKLARVIQ